MTSKNRVARVLAAVVLAAAAGCTFAIGQAATSPISAPSTPGSAEAAALAGPATATGPPVASGSGASTAPTNYRAIPIDSLPFPQPGNSPFSAAQQEALQAVLTESVAQPPADGVQGVTAAVVSPEGSWAGAAGVDGSAVLLVPTSMSGIASITKTVTAAEVLHLVQAGLVDLDAPASDYLDHPLLQRNPTVRQLLSHTSGIPDFTAEPAFFAAKDADSNRHWTSAEVLAFATGPIKDPGGKVKDYSNSNYVLLGMLIEKITGLTYAEAAHRDVLAGLGERMVVQDAESPVLPLAMPDPVSGTAFDGHYLPNRSTSSAVGSAGSIAADAPTLATWGYRLYGGQVLPLALTVDMAVSVGQGYGLGTVIFDPLTIGHDGSMEAYTTLLAVAPRDRLSIAIIFVNTGATPARPDFGRLVHDIRAALGIQ